MKLIKSIELKKGDWFRTQEILGSLNEKNEIIGTSWVSYVKKVKKRREKNKAKVVGNDIYITSWTIVGDEITKGGEFKKGSELFLLNKKERMEFNRRLILLSLEDKNEK